jgi:hypothetical protein
VGRSNIVVAAAVVVDEVKWNLRQAGLDKKEYWSADYILLSLL